MWSTMYARIALSLATGAALLLGTARSEAGGGQAARFAFLDTPPPAPLAPPEGPAPEAEEFARRPWEIAPAIGASSPFCHGETLGIGRCGDTSSGSGAGLAFTFRITPYVGLGVAARASRFRFEPSLGGGEQAAAASASQWIGAFVRGYFLDRGRLDPYVEVGFGRGAVSTTYGTQAGELEIGGAGPATMIGAGLDMWVLPALKLGPSLAYRWAFLSELRVCQAGACGTYAVADGGAPASDVEVSLVGTFAFGREM
jgi:hypothetical protein